MRITIVTISALFAAGLLLCGCEKKKNNDFPETALTISFSYKTELPDVIKFYAIKDSVLVGYSFLDSCFCDKVILSGDGRKCISVPFLHRGRSQEEMISPIFASHGDSLYVVDHESDGGSKLFCIPMYSAQDQNTWEVGNIVKNEYSGSVAALAWSGVNKFVTSMINIGTPDFLFLYDRNTREYVDLHYKIDDGCDGETYPKSIIYAGNSGVFYNEELNRLSYTCGDGRYFEILGIESNSIKSSKVVLDHMPVYTSAKSGDSYTAHLKDNTYRGIVSWATPERIYLTYVNPAFAEDMEGGYPGYYYDVVDVFSWDGEQMARLHTERPFASFIVDENDVRLYTCTNDLESGDVLIDMYMIP